MKQEDKHFMVDKNILKEMVSFAKIKKDDIVLEIGAGKGNLTKELSKVCKKVIAIESDRAFKNNLKKIPNTYVIIGNALSILKRKSLYFNKIVSNIPYSISEALIRELTEKNFDLAVLTVPKKFAYRLSAKPNEPLFSKLSIITQLFFNIQIVKELKKDVFEPKPKTNSVIIKLLPKPDSLVQDVFRREKMKVKNAIREALCKYKELTKNQARKIIKRLKINNNVLNKKIAELNKKEVQIIIESLKQENSNSSV